MYLAEKTVFGITEYYIRETYQIDGIYRSRDLLRVGRYPEKYIVYPGGRSFYIDDRIEEELLRKGKQPSSDELEDLFWPFIDNRVRRAIEPYKSRSKRSSQTKRLSRQEVQHLHSQAHPFDKRRLLYLRFGHLPQGSEKRIPVSLLKKIMHKSRDEIEQYFIQNEKILKPIERKTYVYIIFDIQRFFKEFTAKKLPQSLDQQQVDQYFIQELCRLNQSSGFFNAEHAENILHDYLKRYAIMFFDYDYGSSSFLEDYIRNFMNRHRFYSPPKPKVDMDEASKIFKIKKEILKAMTKEGLNKLYRRRAQKLHPDVGGNHELFIQLQRAYQELLILKNKSAQGKDSQSNKA
jgi:hypothetical protein